MSFVNYDFSQDTTSGLLPADNYKMEIIAAEETVSKNFANMVKLTFAVTEGHFKGQQVFDYAVLNGDNETAVRIGRGKMKTLLLIGLNRDRMGHPSELVGCKYLVNVKIAPAKDGFDESNKIGLIKPCV